MITLAQQQRSALRTAFSLGIVLATMGLGQACYLRKAVAQAATSALFEFRWKDSGSYHKLHYYQSSNEKLDRATYYLMLRPKDREADILELNITIPDHFNASIKPENLSLCRMQLGGYFSRSRCKDTIPATFKVSEAGMDIELLPRQPISAKGTYAVVMKIFNPDYGGMFQFNALARLTGELPLLVYVGSWIIDIN